MKTLMTRSGFSSMLVLAVGVFAACSGASKDKKNDETKKVDSTFNDLNGGTTEITLFGSKHYLHDSKYMASCLNLMNSVRYVSDSQNKCTKLTGTGGIFASKWTLNDERGAVKYELTNKTSDSTKITLNGQEYFCFESILGFVSVDKNVINTAHIVLTKTPVTQPHDLADGNVGLISFSDAKGCALVK